MQPKLRSARAILLGLAEHAEYAANRAIGTESTGRGTAEERSLAYDLLTYTVVSVFGEEFAAATVIAETSEFDPDENYFRGVAETLRRLANPKRAK